MRVVFMIVGCAVLWSLESLVPLYRFRDRLRHAVPNLALTALVLLTYLGLSFAAESASSRAGLLPLAALPVWLQVIAGIAALDGFAYVAHVLLHKTPLAWRFHRLHHSDDQVDVTTAFRQHPVESVWRVAWQLPPILLFGLPLWIVVIYLTISALNAQLEHANVRVPRSIDRIARLLVVTPSMHKVHHSSWHPETDSNYANIFSVWDRLFGTYTRDVDFAALRYGLDA